MALTPIPALPDTERRTEYNPVVASVGPYDIDFHIYGDGTDYENWVEVWHDGVELSPGTQWTLALESGNALATASRPLTDAQVTLVTARSGEIVIRGARRPRRTTQFTEGVGVSARDHNKTYTDIIASARELFDRMEDTLQLTGTGEAYDANNLPIRGVGTATEDDDAVNLAQVNQILSGGAQADGSYSEGGTGSITMPFTTRMRFMLDMRDYCAGDGSDEAAGILKAIDQAVATGKTLIVGGKTFTANSKITKGIGLNHLHMAFERGGSIVFGAGVSAGLDFTLSSYIDDVVGYLRLDSPRIRAAAIHSDPAIKAVWSSWIASAIKSFDINDAIIDQIEFNTHQFGRGIHISKAFVGNISRPDIKGSNSVTGAAIYLNNCVDIHIMRCSITYFQKGIHITTGDDATPASQTEGIQISQGSIYNIEQGVYVDGLSSGNKNAIGIKIEQTHIGSSLGSNHQNVYFDKVSQSSIADGELYCNTTAALPAIELIESGSVRISGNNIYGIGTVNASQHGIKLKDLSGVCSIKDNHIATFGIGLEFESVGNSLSSYGGNIFDSCITPIIDNGTYNYDLGNHVVNSPTGATITPFTGRLGFSSYLAISTSNDKTGDGTPYDISGWTEISDTLGAFTPSTGQFVTNRAGKYHFNFAITFGNLASGHNRSLLRIVTTDDNFDVSIGNIGAMRDNNNFYTFSGSITLDLAANKTVLLRVFVFGGTKTVSISGSSNHLTYFNCAML